MSIQAVGWVLDHSQSRGIARLVLISIANHASNSTAECNPGVRTIAREAGVSTGSVSNHVKTLLGLGELEIVKQGDRENSTTYRLPRCSGDEHPVQPRGEQKQEEDIPTSSSNGSVQSDEHPVQFDDFLLERARQWVAKRKRSGLKVTSPEGLAITKTRNPEFVAESKRVWAHRDCATCSGEGSVGKYAEGAGMVQVTCREPA